MPCGVNLPVALLIDQKKEIDNGGAGGGNGW